MHALQRGYIVFLLAGLLSACGSLIVSGQTPGGRPAGGASGAVQRDLAITAAINRLLVRDAAISAFDVRVDTRDGVVQLNGHVRDRQAKQRVIELARSADGVTRVESHLMVVPR